MNSYYNEISNTTFKTMFLAAFINKAQLYPKSDNPYSKLLNKNINLYPLQIHFL